MGWWAGLQTTHRHLWKEACVGITRPTETSTQGRGLSTQLSPYKETGGRGHFPQGQGANAVNPKAGGKHLETWESKSPVPASTGGRGPAQEALRQQLPEAGPRWSSLGSFHCLVQASHGATVLQGSLWGGPEPHTMVLSELSDLEVLERVE